MQHQFLLGGRGRRISGRLPRGKFKLQQLHRVRLSKQFGCQPRDLLIDAGDLRARFQRVAQHLFSQSGDKDETGTCNTNFQFPTGSSQLNVETSTSLNDCNNPGFLAADVWTGSQGGTFGPYTETPTSTNGGFIPHGRW